MATSRVFNAMLKDFMPNNLLKEEMIKRDWILQNVKFDNSWKGGEMQVPFKGGQASSIAFGALSGSTDIASDTLVKGTISTMPEAWGSLIFLHRDLMENNKVSKASFLKMLPDQIEDFLAYMKEVVSVGFLDGPHFATLTSDGDDSGNITVDRPERFQIGQKCYVDDDNSDALVGYVDAINMDTGVVHMDTTRAGGTDGSYAAYTVAQNAKVYHDGSQASGFTSLRSQLLSNANGGGATLFGETKTTYPFLQAANISGTAWTSSTFLQDIFDGYVTVKRKGKGNPSKVLVSYRNLGYVMTILEQQKGAYHADPKSTKVSAYGWTEIDVFGPKGRLSVVGINEMPDDLVYYLDPAALKIYTNGGFRKRVSPDGDAFFEVRATTGYSYIVDTCFFGSLVAERPSHCGVAHSIP